MKKAQAGFTLVELLIVIVIIAILAAITFVAYGNLRNRANDSAVRSAATQAATKLQLFRSENDRYPRTGTELSGIIQPQLGDTYATHANTFTYCYNNITDTAAIGMVSITGAGFVVRNGTVHETTGWSQGLMQNICPNKLGVEMNSATDKRWAWVVPNSNPPTWSSGT